MQQILDARPWARGQLPADANDAQFVLADMKRRELTSLGDLRTTSERRLRLRVSYKARQLYSRLHRCPLVFRSCDPNFRIHNIFFFLVCVAKLDAC